MALMIAAQVCVLLFATMAPNLSLSNHIGQASTDAMCLYVPVVRGSADGGLVHY
jgi:hypothetical protein